MSDGNTEKSGRTPRVRAEGAQGPAALTPNSHWRAADWLPGRGGAERAHSGPRGLSGRGAESEKDAPPTNERSEYVRAGRAAARRATVGRGRRGGLGAPTRPLRTAAGREGGSRTAAAAAAAQVNDGLGPAAGGARSGRRPSGRPGRAGGRVRGSAGRRRAAPGRRGAEPAPFPGLRCAQRLAELHLPRHNPEEARKPSSSRSHPRRRGVSGPGCRALTG